MVEIICAIIAAAAVIISAFIGYHTKETRRTMERRAERRAHESRLAMELMYATCSLALVTAKKLTGMHTNGDVKAAMDAADNAMKEYINFSLDQAAANYAKG
jgi:hypothetical protein